MKDADAASRNIKVLSWFNFFLDFRLYGPVAVIIFARICGSYAAGMAVFGATMFAGVLFELPTGVLSDRVGRRPTLILGQAASFLAVLGYAIAGSLRAGGIAVLFAGAALEGLSRAFFSGNNGALLYDSLKASGREEEFHGVLGKLSSFFQIALAISAIAGGAISQKSFALALWLSVLPQAAGFALSFRVVEPGNPAKDCAERGAGASLRHFLDAMKAYFSNKRLLVVSSVNAFSGALGEAAFQFSSAFFASLWPLWAIGFSKTIANLGAALSYRLSGRLIDRFGAFPVLIVSRAYGRVSGILAAVFPGPLSPVITSSSSLFFGTGIVANETIVQREFTDSQRATMGSIGSMMEGLLFAGAAPLLGLLADRVGPVKAFLIVQIAMLPAVIALWIEYRKRRVAPIDGHNGRG